MRRYRVRKKAGLIQSKSVTSDDKSRIVELEARIEELEACVARLQSENARLKNAKKNVTGYENVTQPVDAGSESKPEPIDASVHADGRCQASTAKGERCGNKRGLIIIDSVLRDGRIVKFAVCPAHQRKWKRREGKLFPHSSVLRKKKAG